MLQMAFSISFKLDLFIPLRFLPNLRSFIMRSSICLTIVFYISLTLQGKYCWGDASNRRFTHCRSLSSLSSLVNAYSCWSCTRWTESHRHQLRSIAPEGPTIGFLLLIILALWRIWPFLACSCRPWHPIKYSSFGSLKYNKLSLNRPFL